MARDTFTPLDFQIKDEIVNNLNDLKETHGYNQKDIIEGTGLSQALISHYFKGRRMPTQQNLQILANFFNVPVWEIDPRQKPLQNKTFNFGDIKGDKVNVVGDVTGSVTFNNGKDSIDKLHDSVIEKLGTEGVLCEKLNLDIHKLLIEYHRNLNDNTYNMRCELNLLSKLLESVLEKQSELVDAVKLLVETQK